MHALPVFRLLFTLTHFGFVTLSIAAGVALARRQTRTELPVGAALLKAPLLGRSGLSDFWCLFLLVSVESLSDRQ